MVVFNVPVSGILKIKAPAGTQLKKAYAGTKQFKLEEVAKDQYFIHLPVQVYTTPQVIVIETGGGGKGGQYQEAKT